MILVVWRFGGQYAREKMTGLESYDIKIDLI
ncbi:GnsA/GnsB family addiction module toxin [Escherichia coli]